MLKTRVMPCLLVSNGRLVKTVKFKHPTYIGDPVNAIKIYNEKEVDELVLLDITATPEGRKPNLDFLSEVTDECFMPLAYGGGIRDLEDIKRIFGLGIEKVAINSYAVENPAFIEKAAAIFGSQSILLSMDVKKNLFGKYIVYSNGGRTGTTHDPVSWASRMERMGAGEIFLNSIDQDGMMDGYDISLIRKVTDAVSIPLIACGGAGKLADFKMAVVDGGASAVAAGSMVVYQGKNKGVLINFPSRDELISLLDKR
jgi:imidazole glycerol-phosphate synthase subunit HisF